VELVAAFRATLEEVLEADIIVHVRDAAHDETEAQKADVLAVLAELGISADDPRPRIEVLNKIDLLDPDVHSALLLRNHTGEGPVAISALSGDGLQALLGRFDTALAREDEQFALTLDAADGASLAWVYRHGRVTARQEKGRKIHLMVAAGPTERPQFAARFEGKG
jgi:GTP-binding protein HflX